LRQKPKNSDTCLDTSRRSVLLRPRAWSPGNCRYAKNLARSNVPTFNGRVRNLSDDFQLSVVKALAHPKDSHGCLFLGKCHEINLPSEWAPNLLGALVDDDFPSRWHKTNYELSGPACKPKVPKPADASNSRNIVEFRSVVDAVRCASMSMLMSPALPGLEVVQAPHHLTDRELADIGITRSDIERIASGGGLR
jgi:Domain of unknown function (DUF1127)